MLYAGIIARSFRNTNNYEIFLVGGWVGLVWVGLVWFGCVWFGLVGRNFPPRVDFRILFIAHCPLWRAFECLFLGRRLSLTRSKLKHGRDAFGGVSTRGVPMELVFGGRDFLVETQAHREIKSLFYVSHFPRIY